MSCQWCKKKNQHTKQHTFAKLPPALCLHLKRFDSITNKKISDPVSFPAVLDMGPYLPHWREIEQTSIFAKTKEENETRVMNPSVLYDLCGVINHTGSLFQGHYVANVKVDTDWYSCNDNEVHCISEETALKGDEAYMLFYTKRK